MPEIQAKRFPYIPFHCFPLSIDKITWSLTTFINFKFYLLATSGSNYMWNWSYFERVADLNREKKWAPTNLANIGHQKKTLKWVLKEKKIYFCKVIINCLILRLSIATQLPTNSLLMFASNQFSFLNEQKNSCICQYNLMESVKSR